MTTDKTFVICDIASLELWRGQLRSTTGSLRLPAVRFNLEALSEDQNQSFSVRAQSFRIACGCKSGSLVTSVAVAALIIYFFASGNRLSDISVLKVLVLAATTVFAAVAGKVLGLFWARWRSLRLAAALHNTIAGPQPRPRSERRLKWL